ncbi:unnamed protein product [Rotaria sordida]|uniref:Uncharacterized protein n=1 Tax=Rotaria sordida TaxID=392033 RepID=A0A814JVD2_9BILA|nr:unnamed protein product [Rotaria sordida]CAF1044197.1 unnamed protein product [Rotaria sordida]
MADTEAHSKRKKKYKNSFSNISQKEAESILGFELDIFYDSQIPLKQFITTTTPEQLKKKIFERLIDCIISEGYPEAAISPMNESVVRDNIGVILQAVVSYYKLTMNRNDLKLLREKEIITKRDALGKGLVQLLLALKSMSNGNNDEKLVYGFLTTGIQWQLVAYDGQKWKLSEASTVLLPKMIEKEDQWLKNNTQILDVIYNILSSI